MNIPLKKTVAAMGGILLAGAMGTVAAHGLEDVGAPACLEANFMMADAMNNNPAGFGPAGAPWAAANGPGQVIEGNIVTGQRGITVHNPFIPANNSNPDICPAGPGVVCELPVQGPFGGYMAPWKPTGVLSGGLNGHAFISSAAQQALTEFHRDGTPIRTVSYKPYTGNPVGGPGFGTVPRPLGTQMMPNGNLIQAICDANFFNASNSDSDPGYTDPAGGHNTSWQYFPPVYSTPARAQNSRLLVMNQETLEVIDEYSYPYGDAREELWGCMAGIAFTGEGMGVSMFHTAAIAMVDWTDKAASGVGNNPNGNGSKGKGNKAFAIGDPDNQAVVTRWIDLRADASGNTVPDNDPTRRDSLRAWGLDEDGTIYVTDRERSLPCTEGQGAAQGCNPTAFRQKVQVVDFGNSYPSRTIGLDPGVNVIAGIRPNRMSAVACNNITGNAPDGRCDVETLMIAASAFNPSMNIDGGRMKPGGGVGEYSILPADADGNPDDVTGLPTTPCTGAHGPPNAASNTGCAQPIAQFLGRNPSTGGGTDFVDPRMLMVIHEAFVQ
jgi:hypothetical protein